MKSIDTPTTFAKWLNQIFDNLGDPAEAIADAERMALRIGAGCVEVPTGQGERSALDYLGRLLAWCRERIDSELLWNTEQAAQRIGISPRSLWAMTKSGRIPSMKVGRLVFFSPDAVRQWIAKTHVQSV